MNMVMANLFRIALSKIDFTVNLNLILFFVDYLNNLEYFQNQLTPHGLLRLNGKYAHYFGTIGDNL